jgi:hypothetical protein
MDKLNIKSKTNYRQALEVKHINAEKKTKEIIIIITIIIAISAVYKSAASRYMRSEVDGYPCLGQHQEISCLIALCM